jgi:hypothetical protein
MYFTVESVAWCIRLKQEVLFRLTYRREWIEELETWADFLVSSEELAIL